MKELEDNELTKVSGGTYVETSLCSGCGACISVCPAGAIHINSDGDAYVDGNCIDCGICRETCHAFM